MAGDAPEPDVARDNDETSSQAGSAGEAVAAPSEARAPARLSRRSLGLSVALVTLIAVIVVDVVVIVNGANRGDPPAASGVAAEAPSSRPLPVEAPSSSGAVAVEAHRVDSGLFLDYDDDDEPRSPRHAKHAQYKTVHEAAAWTCFTSSVDGLSRQIIRQARCIDPRAFVAVPRRPNLVTRSHVFLYLEAPARAHLLRALDANRNKTLIVNSALRTVAQQYLLQSWYAHRRCGIKLAALPGESNHEAGLALDIAGASAWRSALEAHQFHWMGRIDGMHFDYKGPGAAKGLHVDVKAFQQLYNENHPHHPIAANGRYNSATARRLGQSPAAGFAHGPRCLKRRKGRKSRKSRKSRKGRKGRKGR